ncbi:MAG: TonB-dependent receptor plug [Bacteroidetes bacterium]|nr:TonB-dependent receptor plug [Bacteroidota bacterium]
MSLKHVLIVASLLSPWFAGIAQTGSPKGTIKGRVIDADSRIEIPGAHVMIQGTTLGAATDDNGEFMFKDIPVGTYALRCSHISYEAIVKTDLIVGSARLTHVRLEMHLSAVEISPETITAGYFAATRMKPLSAIAFSSEEIRRAPGAGGDISRIIFGLPSLAKVNDTKNSLIVRGGSPVENGFFVDNIEIPNINHFPVQGSTEGPIGILNVDFVEDVTFSSGGFSAGYGGRLSSIMEIGLREGNREDTDFQLDLSLQGFGGTLEGPIDKGKGSFLISARRSYLDLILDLMNEHVGLPTYSDLQGKASYHLSDRHTISLLNVLSLDSQVMSQQNALDSKLNIYPRYAYVSNTGGVNWQWLWGKSGYSQTSIAQTYARTDVDYIQTRGEKLLLDNASIERESCLRNTNHWILDAQNTLTFGVDFKYTANRYDQFYSDYQDALGQGTSPLAVHTSVRTTEAGIFAEYVFAPQDLWSFSVGARVDRYAYAGRFLFSPRISATARFSERTTLTAAYGVHFQHLPWIIAAQNESFKTLSTPRADHAILSFHHLLSESTRLTLEVYGKWYSGLPVDPSQPGLFLFDEAVLSGIFLNHAQLVSAGEARSHGVELSIQKKLAEDVYGLAAASYFRSWYRDFSGRWYRRAYDNVFSVSAEGGYKPNQQWEFSLRWLYAGGAPYTPFDVQASQTSHKGVLDASRINGARLPAFHSLNIRADRRFHFTGSTLVVYLSIWNAYGRRNIAAYTWNEIDNTLDEETMWGLLPVFGITYQF